MWLMQEDESAELEGTNGVVGIEGAASSACLMDPLWRRTRSALCPSRRPSPSTRYLSRVDGVFASVKLDVLVLGCPQSGEDALAQNCS